MQRAWVPSLVRELDPTCCNEEVHTPQLSLGAAKYINKYFKD